MKGLFQENLNNGENSDMKIQRQAKQFIVMVLEMGSHWHTIK